VTSRLPPLGDQTQRSQHCIQPRQRCIGEEVHRRAERNPEGDADAEVTPHGHPRQRHDRDPPIVLDLATPAHPAVDQEAAEHDLQQRVRVEPGLGEHQRVQGHRDQTDRPGKGHPARHQPHAEHADAGRRPFQDRRVHSANVTDKRA
jgi:hypothetical protein